MALLGGAGLVGAAIRSGNQGDSRCGAALPLHDKPPPANLAGHAFVASPTVSSSKAELVCTMTKP